MMRYVIFGKTGLTVSELGFGLGLMRLIRDELLAAGTISPGRIILLV